MCRRRKKYLIRKLSEVPTERSSCGYRQSLLTYRDKELIGFHIVKISDAKKHYHKQTTEYYFVLEGKGKIELDDEVIDVGEGDLVVIKPGVKHRAFGDIKALIISVPPFTEEDMYFS